MIAPWSAVSSETARILAAFYGYMMGAEPKVRPDLAIIQTEPGTSRPYAVSRSPGSSLPFLTFSLHLSDDPVRRLSPVSPSTRDTPTSSSSSC